MARLCHEGLTGRVGLGIGPVSDSVRKAKGNKLTAGDVMAGGDDHLNGIAIRRRLRLSRDHH